MTVSICIYIYISTPRLKARQAAFHEGARVGRAHLSCRLTTGSLIELVCLLLNYVYCYFSTLPFTVICLLYCYLSTLLLFAQLLSVYCLCLRSKGEEVWGASEYMLRRSSFRLRLSYSATPSPRSCSAIGVNHLSNTTCLTNVFFRSDE